MRNIMILILFTCLLHLSLARNDSQIRNCIIKEANLTAPVEPSQLCKDPKDASCFSSFYSMQYCLLLNGCNVVKPKEDMTADCWNCWADLQVESSVILDFQDTIRGCWESYTMLLMLGFYLISMLAL